MGDLVGPVSAWLFNLFGHWGPRIVLIAIGTLFAAGSFWLARRARENEGDAQRSETLRFPVLSWALILLVLSLVTFIIVGPHLRDPTIDGVLSYWWASPYPALTAFLLFVSVIGVQLRWNLEDFRETGAPLSLLRPATYLIGAVVIVLFFSWKAIAGAA
jgi:hypothetical protein